MRRAFLALPTFHRACAMPKIIVAQKKQLQQPIHMMSLKHCHTTSGKGTTINFDDMGMAQFLKPIFDPTQDWIEPAKTFGQVFEALNHHLEKKKGNDNAGCLSAVFDKVFKRPSKLDEESSELEEESSGLDEESSGLDEESSVSDEESSELEKRKLIFGHTRWYVESDVDGRKNIKEIKRVLYVTETELQASKYHRNFVNYARMEKEKEDEEFRLKYFLDEDEYAKMLELDEDLDLEKRLDDFLIKASKIKFNDFSGSDEVKNLMEKIKDYKPTEIILDLAPYGKSPDTDTLNKTYLLSSMIKERFPHLSFQN